MGIQSELERIMDLQPDWSPEMTGPMIERGQLVRRSGRAWLETFAADLVSALDIPPADFLTSASDGMTKKTEVPWFRFCSKSQSPRPTEGWYCVYLFDTVGESVYLALSQGSTSWTGTDFKVRPHEELRNRALWGRTLLAGQIGSAHDLVESIQLRSRRSPLGPAYEAGTVVAKRYTRDSVPNEETLIDDAVLFANFLGILYRAEQEETLPGDIAPEVAEALEAAARTAGKRPPPGRRGVRQNAAQRRAIELQAMNLARVHLEGLGYLRIRDVSGRQSYDYLCQGPAGDFYVEVKGTTSSGDSVILTRNEVELHRAEYPSNALIVVSGIELAGDDRLDAVGGSVQMTSPWFIDDDDLSVISYQYYTP